MSKPSLPAPWQVNPIIITSLKLFWHASKAASSVLSAVSEGELTPIEGTRVMGLIDSYRRTLELTEIEERLQALEETTNA